MGFHVFLCHYKDIYAIYNCIIECQNNSAYFLNYKYLKVLIAPSLPATN